MNNPANPISVLMFCPQFAPLVGGTERQAGKLAIALAERGHRVRVLTPLLDPRSARLETMAGVEIHRFPLWDLSSSLPLRGIGLLNIPFLSWQLGRTLVPFLREADILHAHSGGLLSALAIRHAAKALCSTVCKVAIASPTEVELLSHLPLRGGRMLTSLARDTSAWIAISQQIATELLGLGIPQGRINLIPNGVELPEPRERCRPVRRLLHVGRLSSNINRDVPTLLRAFDRVAHLYPDAELTLVGGGDLLEQTRAITAGLETAAKIKIMGWSDATPWYEWADAYIQPSRQEGLSNALLEAMSHGLPCIANDIPANREVLNNCDAGMLAPIGDVNALSRQLAELMASPALAAELGKRARASAKARYAIDVVAEQTEETYRQVLRYKHEVRS